jgi:hypothetical protein
MTAGLVRWSRSPALTGPLGASDRPAGMSDGNVTASLALEGAARQTHSSPFSSSIVEEVQFVEQQFHLAAGDSMCRPFPA